MTKPTADQLAANVPPIIREYIDAKIEEVIASRRIAFQTQARAMQRVIESADERLAKAELFEREVRAHLGI